jgi:hypothetical protein
MKNLKEIDKVVADLMEIDPTLKPDQIRLVIAKLLEEKPQVVLDENFRMELRQRLLAEIEKVQSKNTTSNFNFMNKFKYALATASAVAIVALIFVSLPKDQGPVLLPGKQQITRVSENAFGSLATLTVASGRGQGGGGMGGDTASLSSVDPKMSAPAVGMGGGSSESLIYQPTNYKFVYKGEEFAIDSDKMAVYEREKGFGTSVNLETILKNFNVGSFNIGKFGNARLDYLTASQDEDKGYTLSLDLRQGNVYIGQNWERWPNIYASCADNQACYEQNRLKIEQIPADDAVINISNQFLDEYGIDRSGFGAPFVQDMWKMEYARSVDQKMMPYVPEQVTVIYPTKIEGNEIYDQGGVKTGVYVAVDVRNNKVSSVGELNGQRYQSSDYVTEKDTKRIISVAQKGGYQSYYGIYETAGAKTETVELGNPTTGYVRLWQYSNNQSKELFVPSLIFPVTNSPANFYSKNIIVPIVKEVLDSQKDQPIPMPADMPVRAMESESI